MQEVTNQPLAYEEPQLIDLREELDSSSFSGTGGTSRRPPTQP